MPLCQQMGHSFHGIIRGSQDRPHALGVIDDLHSTEIYRVERIGYLIVCTAVKQVTAYQSLDYRGEIVTRGRHLIRLGFHTVGHSHAVKVSQHGIGHLKAVDELIHRIEV